MACGKGSCCEACAREAIVRLDWPAISGQFCGHCASTLLDETEVPTQVTLLRDVDAVPDTAVRQ